MSSNVVFGEKVDGVWLDCADGGEICIYSEKYRGIVVGKYKEKNKTQINSAIGFNPDGVVFLQKWESHEYVHYRLDADKVVEKLENFLNSLNECLALPKEE